MSHRHLLIEVASRQNLMISLCHIIFYHLTLEIVSKQSCNYLRSDAVKVFLFLCNLYLYVMIQVVISVHDSAESLRNCKIGMRMLII